MVNKQEKIEETPQNSTQFREAYDRYQKRYNLVMGIGIILITVIWYFFSIFWGATALIFGLWSWFWYEEGAMEDCIDEYEYAYPENGFRKMFRSWPWFAALDVIAYFICRINIPSIFT